MPCADIERDDGDQCVVQAKNSHVDKGLQLKVGTKHRCCRGGKRQQKLVDAKAHDAGHGLHDNSRDAHLTDGFDIRALQLEVLQTKLNMNLCIGTITPPVGSILFTGCKVGHVKIEQVIKELLPYFFAILVALLLVTYIPAISMTLPTLAGLIK